MLHKALHPRRWGSASLEKNRCFGKEVLYGVVCCLLPDNPQLIASQLGIGETRRGRGVTFRLSAMPWCKSFCEYGSAEGLQNIWSGAPATQRLHRDVVLRRVITAF